MGSELGRLAEQAGIRVEPGDSKSFAQAIGELVSNQKKRRSLVPMAGIWQRRNLGATLYFCSSKSILWENDIGIQEVANTNYPTC